MSAITSLTRQFVALTALRWLPIGVMSPVLVLLLLSRGLDTAAIGGLLALYSIVTVLLELPTGGWADTIGRRPVLLAGGAINAAGLLVVTLAPTLPLITCATVLLGTARALDSGALEAWYVDSVHAVDPEAELASGLSRSRVALAAALACGSLAGGALALLDVELRSAGAPIGPLLVPGVVAAFLAVVSVLAVARTVRESSTSTPGSIPSVATTVAQAGRLVRHAGPLRRMTVLVALTGGVLASMELLAPLVLAGQATDPATSAAMFSVVLAVAMLGSAVGAGIAPALARRAGGGSRGLVAALLLASVATLGLGVPEVAVVTAAYVAVSVAIGASQPLAAEITHRAAPAAQRTTILSAQSVGFQVAGAAGSATVGILAARSTLMAVAVLAGVLVVAAVVAAVHAD